MNLLSSTDSSIYEDYPGRRLDPGEDKQNNHMTYIVLNGMLSNYFVPDYIIEDAFS